MSVEEEERCAGKYTIQSFRGKNIKWIECEKCEQWIRPALYWYGQEENTKNFCL